MSVRYPTGARRATRLLFALSFAAIGTADAQDAARAGAIKLRFDYAGADSSEQLPPPIRLLTVTLAEGLANYGADPLRTTAPGRQIEQSRKRFLRHAKASRISDNFARFDRVLRDLRAQRVSWTDAYAEGFSSDNDASFYFMGYQMAKAIELHCGNACLGRLFEQPPVEFFRQYIALYRKHPDIPGRFSSETEAFVLPR